MTLCDVELVGIVEIDEIGRSSQKSSLISLEVRRTRRTREMEKGHMLTTAILSGVGSGKNRESMV